MSYAIGAGIVVAVAAVGGAVASSISSSEALEQQEQALQTQELNNNYKTAIRKNQTLDQLHMQLQKGEAHQAASGARFNSPTFFNSAVQGNIQAGKALKNANVAGSLNQYKLQMEQETAEQQNTARQLQGAFKGISGAASGASIAFTAAEEEGN